MTADTVFSLASAAAVLGWIILALGIVLRRDGLRDTWAGLIWPLGLSALYLVLIAFFFWSAPGGFDTLANVQLLFTSQWAALAGWVHYLAFDLFIGTWIARQVMTRGQPRLILLVLLPLTFLFGPAGLALWKLSDIAFSPSHPRRSQTP